MRTPARIITAQALIAVAALCALTVSARAGDLGSTYTVPPQIPSAETWTGFSLGVGGGVAFLNADVSSKASRTDNVTSCRIQLILQHAKISSLSIKPTHPTSTAFRAIRAASSRYRLPMTTSSHQNGYWVRSSMPIGPMSAPMQNRPAPLRSHSAMGVGDRDTQSQ